MRLCHEIILKIFKEIENIDGSDIFLKIWALWLCFDENIGQKNYEKKTKIEKVEVKMHLKHEKSFNYNKNYFFVKLVLYIFYCPYGDYCSIYSIGEYLSHNN